MNTISTPLKISCCISITIFVVAIFIYCYSSFNHGCRLSLLNGSQCESYGYMNSSFKIISALSYVSDLMNLTIGI